MIIKSAILDKINNPQTRIRIAGELGVGEQTIAYQMRKNAPNGRLTKMDALIAISKECHCDVNEILEEETINEEAQK